MHRMNVRGVRTLLVAVCLTGLAATGGTVSTAQQGASVRGRVEIGVPVTARRLSDQEKAEVWPKLLEIWPNYDAYEARSGRNIKVFRLDRT